MWFQTPKARYSSATKRPFRGKEGQKMSTHPPRIAFQGEPGAYSHQACVAERPEMEALPCAAFEDVIDAVVTGKAAQAMLPVENTTYGRGADIHRLLPDSGL